MPPMISPSSAQFNNLKAGGLKLPTQPVAPTQAQTTAALTYKSIPSVGQKAAQPGGLSSGQTNTIAPKYQATGTDTSATGNTTNASVTNNSGSMGALINAGLQNPPTQPLAIGTTNQSPFQVPVPTDTQNNPVTPAPTGNLYTGQLANTAMVGSPTARQYTTQTADYGAGNIPIGQNAANILAQYGQQYNQIGQKGAAFESGERTTGTSPVAQGNAAVTAQTTAEQQQAVTGAAQMALQGTGQELTAQNQAANATNVAAGQALGQQQAVQSGLGTAGQLAQPSGTFPFVFNPQTGSFTVSGGNLQGAISGGVQQAMANPALYTSLLNAIQSTYGDASAGMFQQAYIQAGGNPQTAAAVGSGAASVAGAPYSTQASNIQTAGTSVTAANAAGLQQSIQAETNLNTAATNATQLASQVQTALKNSGLDLTNSTDANTAINNLQSRLGNTGYTQLNIAVNDARSAYAAILQTTGSTPTDADTKANQNINSNMSPNQILAAIDQLGQGVYARQQAQHQQTVQYHNQLGGSQDLTNTTNTGTVQTRVGAINTNW